MYKSKRENLVFVGRYVKWRSQYGGRHFTKFKSWYKFWEERSVLPEQFLINYTAFNKQKLQLGWKFYILVNNFGPKIVLKPLGKIYIFS